MSESSDSSMVATVSTSLCLKWKVLGNHSETIIHGLLPYTNYTCFVTANTSAGEGNPSMNLTAQTDETCKYKDLLLDYVAYLTQFIVIPCFSLLSLPLHVLLLQCLEIPQLTSPLMY